MADWRRRDRTARLVRVLRLFEGNPNGLSAAELARRLEVSVRTAQRDIAALEGYAGMPLYSDGSRWRLPEDMRPRPISFSLYEAMALLLSARLMLRYADRADAFTATAYEKLATAMPAPIRQPVADAAYGMRAKPADLAYSKVLGSLVTAWAQRKEVRVTYRGSRGCYERTLWPLFLEPSAIGHSCYLLAWDPKPEAVRVYKLERMQEVRVLERGFDLPGPVSIDELLSRAWAVWASDEVVEVELAFSREVASRLAETIWHPSQEVFERDDGRIGMRLHVASWLEIRHWVLGWGEQCEVMAPPDFRESIMDAVQSLATLYETGVSGLLGATGPVAVAKRRTARRRRETLKGAQPRRAG